MPCDKDVLVVNEKPLLKTKSQNFLRAFDKGKNLGLRRLILRYPTSFMINLVKWHPFLLFKKIPDCNIPKEMNKYKVKTCRKIIKGTNKLLGVIEAKNILSLVYIPDHLKTKEMSKRAFEEDPYMLDFVPDHFKTPEMCERAVDAYPWALEFVPMNIISTQQMCNKAVKKCAWSLI